MGSEQISTGATTGAVTPIPLRRLFLPALLAACVAILVPIVETMVDISSDTTGAAEDAAAKGAPGIPLVLIALFAIFFALGSLFASVGRRTYPVALLHASAAALMLVFVPAAISVWFADDPLNTFGTYQPWLIGLAAMLAMLLPGALLQAWLIRKADAVVDR